MKNVLLVVGLLLFVHAPDITPVQQEIPAYAKWGMVALKEIKQKYPDANVIDYLHIGSETKGDTTIEKFKLWLKDDRHEFGLFIHITFKTQTGEIVNINFQETDR